MTESATGSRDGSPSATPSRTPSDRAGASRRALAPTELAAWLEAHSGELAGRWYEHVSAGDDRWSSEVAELLQEFLALLVGLIPGCLGPYREQVEPLWREASELYGNVGTARGLAAGEIIEEFQYLREALIRSVHRTPPGGRTASLGLRDTLRLNRIVDSGVTHASVGHTDALFFALFQGSGVPEGPTPELLDEVRQQLGCIRKDHAELESLLRD